MRKYFFLLIAVAALFSFKADVSEGPKDFFMAEIPHDSYTREVTVEFVCDRSEDEIHMQNFYTAVPLKLEIIEQ